ncbi:MAG TPA: hypothetical protein VMV92_05320, partial [Streptosporangiaceae bacterium]|nr:hypothetical protein [Streptosporangiaceae bacterium]
MRYLTKSWTAGGAVLVSVSTPPWRNHATIALRLGRVVLAATTPRAVSRPAPVPAMEATMTAVSSSSAH